MPFTDSPTIRPLYDVHDGGPPRGYQCQLFQGKTTEHWNGKTGSWPCARVTRTLAGMRTHQRIVHGIKQQQEFQFERIEATTDQQDR